jgi:hypothetical protein
MLEVYQSLRVVRVMNLEQVNFIFMSLLPVKIGNLLVVLVPV